MRFLLKPGWIAFAVLVIAFSVACYTLLAPWQFRRNAERAAQNAAIAASFRHPPAPLARLVPAGERPVPGVEWRQAVVRGHYLPHNEAVVRLRTVNDGPAFEVLTAFHTDDGRTVAIDRGYLAGTLIPPFTPTPAGEVTLVGRIRQDETDPDHRPPFEIDGHPQLYAVDSRSLARLTAQPVSPGYLQLVDDQPGGLGVLPLPETDSGPFLSYAWQWLSFGAMAVFGLAYFIRLEMLQRRAPDEPEGDPAESAAEARAPEHDRLAERYGKARY